MKKNPLNNSINRSYSNFISKCGHEPNYASCIARYKDDLTTFDAVISFKEYKENEIEEDIFWHCIDIEEFLELTSEDNNENFIIVELNEFYD